MKSIVINILFLSCFISSILTLTENSGIWDRIYLIILISIFMLQILIWSNKKYLQIDRATFILTYFYVIFTAISSILNSDYRLLQGGILFFILYYVSFGMYSLFNYEKINKLLFKTIIILYALTVIIPLMVNGIDSTPYQGIFYNPNSLGFISATTFAVVISIFIFSTEKIILNNYRKTNYIKSKFFLYLMLLSFLFYQVVELVFYPVS